MIENETLMVIKNRRSIRSYTHEQIKEEELKAIIEAGMYAPNAGGQAWHFTVVQNKDLLNRLNLAAKEGAKQMNIDHLEKLGENPDFDCLYGAPTLIIVSGSENVPMPLEADCAAAIQNLMLAAESLGLGSCWIFFVLLALNSPKGAELRKELKIPDGYKPFYTTIVGYKNETNVVVQKRKENIVTYIK